jgi:SAM-dependent methyltransferase
MADVYLHGHHTSVLASHGVRTAADSAAYLLPHLRTGQRVLDVGCGPGTITLELADVMALPYAAGSFDVVHAHQVLQHLTDPVGALREMARVTRAGGLVAVRDVDYASMVWHPASDGMARWLELYRRLARLNHAEPDAGRHLVAWAHAAGLTRLTPSASLWTYATPEQTAWWGAVWARRTLESTFATQALERGLATRDELGQISDAWQAWSTHPDAWFAMTHAELVAHV